MLPNRLFRRSRHLLLSLNDTATPEIYTLSLHDALPISADADGRTVVVALFAGEPVLRRHLAPWGKRDRKSTRLNSSHSSISYAVFCLKKKNYAITGFMRADMVHYKEKLLQIGGVMHGVV